MKFNRYIPPLEPKKPTQPKTQIYKTTDDVKIIYDFSVLELNGVYQFDFGDDGDDNCVYITTMEPADNPQYEKEFATYQEQMPLYEKSLETYKIALKDWEAQKSIFDSQEEKRQLKSKRRLFEQLKKELGET